MVSRARKITAMRSPVDHAFTASGLLCLFLEGSLR